MSTRDGGNLKEPTLLHRSIMVILGVIFLLCGVYVASMPMTWGVALGSIVLLLLSADLLMAAIHNKNPLLSRIGPVP